MPAPRILIVEDELIVSADIARRLARLGYEVVGETDNGDDAIRLAGELRPDVILMDIRLYGDSDGIAAADEIRRRFRLPVVYLTAHADDATLQRAKIAEPFGYILKPFDERELRTVLEMTRYKHAAERRLAESERRYATTLASIGDAVIATDPTGRVTFLNPVAERLTGWPLDSAIGAPLTEVFRIINEYTREPVENPAQRVLETGTLVGLANHTLLQARDGHEYPIDDCAAPILDDAGAMTGVVLVFRDVTEERRREEELRQAQKMEAIGRLAGGVAHDFNNILTVISGYCSLLMESVAADHPWHGPVAEVVHASDRAANLTRQLLAFARKQMLQPKVIDLNQVVNESLSLLRRLVASNIELVTELHPTALWIKADPGQIEQVILNLMINARDAMPNGGRLRLVTTELKEETNRMQHLPPGPCAVLIVSDNGMGMDSETAARIWEPFFTTKKVGKGTGLGLATVYGIVMQSGGHIEVESELGRGSTFTVLLPETAERVPKSASAQPADFPRGSETILLVEDDHAVRGMAAQVLHSLGYHVIEARHGIEALEVASRIGHSIHLLATDLVMPHMSGRTLAKLFTTQRPEVRTLFLTGYSDEAALRSELQDSTVHILTKPFSPRALAVKVREILDQPRTE